MQNLSNVLYQQPLIVMDKLCVQQKKKKRKYPLPLKSVYSLIPRLTRHFVALKLYIYSLPRLPPFFVLRFHVQYNTRPLNLQLKSAVRCGCGQQHLHQVGGSTLHARNAALLSARKIKKFQAPLHWRRTIIGEKQCDSAFSGLHFSFQTPKLDILALRESIKTSCCVNR